MLADVLRTDGHRFRKLQPLASETRALRALVRTRQELLRQRVALANQLRSLLESFWAGSAVLFAEIDSPIAMAFLARYPTPSHASRLGEKRLRVFLKHQAYPGRRSATELLDRLRTAPATPCDSLEMQAKGEAVLALLGVLKPLVVQIRRITRMIESSFSSHQDAAILDSFPYVGGLNGAQILSELGDDRGRYLTADQLAAEAGVVPVTISSGKHHGVAFRWACNRRLRLAVTCWADLSRHGSTWAAKLYAQARARGCDHPHAIRILARAWIRVLWRCWQDRRPYDPGLHRAACRLADAPVYEGA
jgi:transposase